jgi:Holliday junction resolvase
MARWAARVDATQAEVVQMLRKHGCSVVSLAGMGSGGCPGCPDLLVGVSRPRPAVFLVEVKNNHAPPSKRRLTPDQQTFIADWKGSPVVILGDAEEACAWVEGLT